MPCLTSSSHSLSASQPSVAAVTPPLPPPSAPVTDSMPPPTAGTTARRRSRSSPSAAPIAAKKKPRRRTRDGAASVESKEGDAGSGNVSAAPGLATPPQHPSSSPSPTPHAAPLTNTRSSSEDGASVCRALATAGAPPLTPAASAASPVSLKPATQQSLHPTVFEVMLNHERFTVDRRYPFLNPNHLFTLDPGKLTRHGSGRGHEEAAEVAELLRPPLHRYGHQPVLLLDYTGLLHLRRVRRARWTELDEHEQALLAEHAELVRVTSKWSMRRGREYGQGRRGRRKSEVGGTQEGAEGLSDQEEESEGESVRGGGTGKKGDNNTVREENGTNDGAAEAVASADTIADIECNGPRTRAELDAVIRHYWGRVSAVRKKLTAIAQERQTLRRARRREALSQEGSVLMLPSAETHEVRLCSGHHYRTVCFVGSHLRDVVPGEGPVPPPPQQHEQQQQPVPQPGAVSQSGDWEQSTNAPASPDRRLPRTAAAHRHRGDRDEEEEEEEERGTAEADLPYWARAEMLGLALFRRRLRSKRQWGGCNDEEAPESATAEERERAVVKAYLNLPACEAAMFRQRAVEKYDL